MIYIYYELKCTLFILVFVFFYFYSSFMDYIHIQVEWKCDHCDKIVFKGAQFRPSYARIHLAAQEANGKCANLCTADDEEAKERRELFRKLMSDLKEKKAQQNRKRKQQAQRLGVREAKAVASAVAKKKARYPKFQPKLKGFLKQKNGAAADIAVAQWAIAHDISPNAMKGPYWKQMNKALASVGATYTPMYDRKIFDKMLSDLKKMAEHEIKIHLKQRPTIGRTLTGDGATKGVPLINFLVHVPGKGVKLLSIVDCTDHLAAGGIKDAMYILLFIFFHFVYFFLYIFSCFIFFHFEIMFL